MNMARRGTKKLRVFVVDDEPTERKGLELLIAREPGYEVCGASAGVDAIERLMPLKPNLAVVDFSVYSERGFELIREICRVLPAVRVLVFSLNDEIPLAQAAFKAGALGYVTKEDGTESLVEALELVSAGHTYLAPAIAAKMNGAGPPLRGDART